MKKSDIALIAAVIVVLILGYFVMKGTKAEPTYTLPLTLSGESGLKELSYKEYQEKIDNDESFVVIVERATCSHCVSYMPVAEKFAKDNGLPLYYFDTDKFEEGDFDDLESSATFFKEKNGNWGTPTTLVQAGHETVDYIEGETTSEKLKKLYEDYFDLDKYKEKK